ncbi:MAG: ABC transporter ATP-binding protein [Clostridiales bacterium]|nr:ABC transporter ATP-binding protein [Clostridiales bacterium]
MRRQGWVILEQKQHALEIEHLSKSYGDVKAVDDISFTVEQGSLFAFLGINGAGKSTTINIICSILKKDGGKITVDGYDLDADPMPIKKALGIVFQTSVLDRDLTVKENLEVRTSFYSMSRAEKKQAIADIVRLLELEPILNRPVKNLSGGQMRRVDIARAMVHRPRLLILDEPTTGLDPKTRLVVWALIDKIRNETGMTVFLTTHYLEEADKATDVVIMDKGKVIAHGTPVELKNRYSHDSIICYRDRAEQLEQKLAADDIPFSYDDEHCAYKIVIQDTAHAKQLLKKFDEFLTDVEIVKGNMDDVFLNVTGQKIHVAEDEADEN